MRATRLIAFALVLLAGCDSLFGKQVNPAYCMAHPTDPDCGVMNPDAAIDAPGSAICTMDDECSGSDAVCDPSVGCVQCTASESMACVGTTPICGSDEMCHGCTEHSQCESKVCRPDGSCSDGSDVAYVDPTGTDNPMCTKAMPCTKVSKALMTNRAFVKFTGTTSEQVTINNQNVTLLADPGSALTESSAGVILTVMGTSQVSIFDLTIPNALGPSGIGLSMPGGATGSLTLQRVSVTGAGSFGISAAGGTLTVQQSTVSGNTGDGITASSGTITVEQSTVEANTGGGISVSSAAFTIVNNFIGQNGGPSSLVGGVNLASVATTGAHQLDFNTITANAGASTVNTGINCGTVTMPIVFDSDIVYANTVSGGGQQLGGSVNCTATYSDIGPDGSAGTGNINADPMFVSTTQPNYHLSSSSPCIDKADPAATLDVDFDGDTRPLGSGRDIGADEFKP